MQAEDRAFINQILDGVIAAHRRKYRGVRYSQGAIEITRALESAASQGDGRALRVMMVYVAKGAESDLKQRVKQEEKPIRVYANGTVEVRRVPDNYSVKANNGATQAMLWAEVTWDEFERMVAMVVEKRDVLAKKAEVLQWVLTLRQKYPQSQTPREALVLDGRDPAELEIAL